MSWYSTFIQLESRSWNLYLEDFIITVLGSPSIYHQDRWTILSFSPVLSVLLFLSLSCVLSCRSSECVIGVEIDFLSGGWVYVVRLYCSSRCVFSSIVFLGGVLFLFSCGSTRGFPLLFVGSTRVVLFFFPPRFALFSSLVNKPNEDPNTASFVYMYVLQFSYGFIIIRSRSFFTYIHWLMYFHLPALRRGSAWLRAYILISDLEQTQYF